MNIEEIFYLHNHTIFKYLYYLLNDEKLAEDYTQETFVRYLNHHQTIKKEPISLGCGALHVTLPMIIIVGKGLFSLSLFTTA